MHNSKTVIIIATVILISIFVGSLVNPYGNVTAGVTFPAYGTILTSAVAVAQRNKLNFIFSAGAGSAVDNAGTGSTDVTITGSTTGSVSTGVTMTNGQLALGAGSSAIKVGDLSGDVVTNGSTVTHMLHVINFVIDGGGSVIVTGDIKAYPQVNYSCTAITKAMISADQSGSITVDVWKANGVIPTSGGKISASAPITLSSSQLNQASSLTGWTLPVAVNDVFGFNVATVSTVTRVVGEIWCQ